ncbi:hypothetical protein H8N03_01090 [Ramlibacter sp. USB13]|uniref:Uncharacterized protein n=1 Tax=Ramlibacter cellulosilyticus TaxID=2764187 RepID=A0A923MKX8_9BURK|nr:hypothetical protein [Ramlibacter cellulosilyticus]MBC5781517.1 hypothetical protein [Ramlibacter cellulosilyticus]
MQSLWPWLAVAAAGALHGMNPAAGWALLAWGGRARAMQALLALAAGQLASVALVAAAVPLALQWQWEFQPLLLQGAAAALLLWMAVRHLRGRRRAAEAHAAVGLWSFIVATAHGIGWILVPALVPLCGGGMPGREITASGSLWLALAAVGVHLAAMLLAAAATAAAVRHAWHAAFRPSPPR